MKRCSFIICFALIFMLAMPMKVDAAEFEPSLYYFEDYKNLAFPVHLEFASKQAGFDDVDEFLSEYPYIYFYAFNIINEIMHTKCYTIFSKRNFGSNFYSFSSGDISYLCLTGDVYSSLDEDDLIMVGIETSSSSNFGLTPSLFADSYVFAARKAGGNYTLGSNVNIGTTEDGVIVPSSLFGDFFPDPRIPGVLEKKLTTVLQTMEVDPLTEVVKILPIGLACLVGWIGLRKGLSLLRQVLFPA